MDTFVKVFLSVLHLLPKRIMNKDDELDHKRSPSMDLNSIQEAKVHGLANLGEEKS